MVEVDAEFPLIRSRLTRQAEADLQTFLDELAADSWREQRLVDTRWAAQFTVFLASLGAAAVTQVGPKLVAALGGDPGRRWSPGGARNYILAVAQAMAAGRLGEARRIVERAAPEGFEDALQAALDHVGRTPELMVDTSVNFAAKDAAERTQGATHKRWQVNSTNPRAEHAALNGETVPVAGHFSNGMAYPGDSGPPGQTANCKCSLVLLTEEAP